MKKIIKTTLLSIFIIICFAMLWYKVIAAIEYDSPNSMKFYETYTNSIIHRYL